MNAIDTNVLVYAVDSTEPVKSQQAIQLLQSLRSVPLVVPWQVAVEFLACLRRWENAGRIRRADTEDYLKRFVLSLPIVHPTVNSLSLALELTKQYSLSHWDSLLLAACIEAGVTTFYNEDLSSGVPYRTVKVQNPFALIR
ncbi:PIN domain-containing protein [Anatilimnocola sp. NA78]|uniref:PIN domain-containing protein n=1 Tax=Anatilimnocola sp. NA78 TaxID=3415683 RepID=UPI003CE525B0